MYPLVKNLHNYHINSQKNFYSSIFQSPKLAFAVPLPFLSSPLLSSPLFSSHPRTCLLLSERREGGEREEEKPWCEREASIGCLSYAPDWEPNLQPRHVSCPRIELTHDLSVYRRTLQPTEPNERGPLTFFILFLCSFHCFLEVFSYRPCLASLCLGSFFFAESKDS